MAVERVEQKAARKGVEKAVWWVVESVESTVVKSDS
jgi:hypothetical protein